MNPHAKGAEHPLRAPCRRARALISADRAFVDVPDLTHVVPDDAGVKELLNEA